MHKENCPEHLESIQHAIRGQKKKSKVIDTCNDRIKINQQ
jgi:hypothetical protein